MVVLPHLITFSQEKQPLHLVQQQGLVCNLMMFLAKLLLSAVISFFTWVKAISMLSPPR